MKILIAIAITIVASVVLLVAAYGRRGKQNDPVSAGKAAELSSLPVGLQVVHDPNPVPSVRDGRSGRTFTWLHKTTVTALDDDTEILEFGAFAWHGGHWVFSTIYDRPFNAKEFAEWYSCPGSAISNGASATDPNNYVGGDTLSSGKTKWYFIGRNSRGEKIKGEAIVGHLAEVKE